MNSVEDNFVKSANFVEAGHQTGNGYALIDSLFELRHIRIGVNFEAQNSGTEADMLYLTPLRGRVWRRIRLERHNKLGYFLPMDDTTLQRRAERLKGFAAMGGFVVSVEQAKNGVLRAEERNRTGTSFTFAQAMAQVRQGSPARLQSR